MSAPTAATRRRGGTTASRRRRRATAAVLVLGLLAVLTAVTMPLAKRVAVNEFGLPLHDAAMIRHQAAEKHLDPALIAAVIYAETRFDPRTSPTGAEGLMQVEPRTALDLARRSGATSFAVGDLQHPATNIAYGSYYLRELLTTYHGSQLLALAAYNGGETNVDRWLARAAASGRRFTVSAIPFAQTRAYVVKVLTAERRYRRTYARELGIR